MAGGQVLTLTILACVLGGALGHLLLESGLLAGMSGGAGAAAAADQAFAAVANVSVAGFRTKPGAWDSAGGVVTRLVRSGTGLAWIVRSVSGARRARHERVVSNGTRLPRRRRACGVAVWPVVDALARHAGSPPPSARAAGGELISRAVRTVCRRVLLLVVAEENH